MKAIAILFLSACGVLVPVKPGVPQVVSERLKTQIGRMTPTLAWTCNGMAPARSREVDCNTEGDAVSMTGWTLLYGNLGSWQLILDSIDENGRPWRNPARVGGTDPNSFSRDQMLGLLEATVSSGDRTGLQSVVRHLQAQGRLCPGDDRCNLTGSIIELWRLVLGQEVIEAERAVNGWTTEVEAATVPPGYQAHLVSRKIMLHAELGTLTSSYSKAAATLARRFPKSLFLRVTNAVANGGDFVAIADDLAACMETWQGPGNAWIGEEIERGCQTFSYGHEYVSLAKYLLQSKELMQ
jgi:hypothetical protein